MPTRQPTEAARQAATAWHARLRQEVDELEKARFLAWLDAPANAEAWREQLALWDLLQAPAEQLGRGGWYRPAIRRRPRLPAWGIAASVVLAALGSLLLWRDPGMFDRTLADAATAPGETRRIELRDGSVVLLDGDTALDIDDGADARTITVRRGRAAFDVASLHSPFLVLSDGHEIRDLSTRFTVDQRPHGTGVVVEQGAVRVSPVRDGDSFELHAGQHARLPRDAPVVVGRIDLATATAWQRGVLLFDDQPLDRVVRELNRYSGTRIVLVGAAGDRRVSGTFRTDDPDAVLRALGAAMGLQVTRIPGVITLVR